MTRQSIEEAEKGRGQVDIDNHVLFCSPAVKDNEIFYPICLRIMRAPYGDDVSCCPLLLNVLIV